MQLTIRHAHPTDLDAIVAFNAQLARESEGRTLGIETLRAGVATLLADHAHGRYYVAESGDLIIGQTLVTYEWSDWRNGMFWWIQSVYVHAEHRGAGVFRALFDAITAEAEAARGVCGLRLYVDEDNASAKAIYEHLGLARTEYRVMERDLSDTAPRGDAAGG